MYSYLGFWYREPCSLDMNVIKFIIGKWPRAFQAKYRLGYWIAIERYSSRGHIQIAMNPLHTTSD